MDAPCPRCGGSGELTNPAGQLQPCWKCEGTGVDPGIQTWFVYIYDRTLTSLQLLQSQSLLIQGDADFVWKATAAANLPTGGSGDWRIRFGYGSATYLSAGGIGAANNLVNRQNICGTGRFPFPVIPNIVIPRAGNILFDIEEIQSAAVTLQIAFIGAKRYPTPR